MDRSADVLTASEEQLGTLMPDGLRKVDGNVSAASVV